MLITAFAAILVTVLLQGSTLGALLRRLSLADHEPPPRLNLGVGKAHVARAQFEAVTALASSPDGEVLNPQLFEAYERRARQTDAYSRDEAASPEAITAHFDVVLAAVAAGRAELVRLHRRHEISDETLHDLEHDLDLEEVGALAAKG
jgi:CPA1 family monovalent cation:H+ antiporter